MFHDYGLKPTISLWIMFWTFVLKLYKIMFWKFGLKPT